MPDNAKKSAQPPESVDRSYRELYSHPEIVEGTLRILGAPWVESIDFGSLKQYRDIFISDGLAKRESDAVWLAQLQDRPALLYFVVEFQSKPLWHMAVRMATVRGLLHERIISQDGLTSGKLPMIIPMVVYNGKRPWNEALDYGDLVERHPDLDELHPRGAYLVLDLHRLSSEILAQNENPAAVLFELETSQKPEELVKGVERLLGMLNKGHPLRKIFNRWVRLVLMNRWLPEVDVPRTDGLEEFHTMMELELSDWTIENMAKGKSEGASSVLALQIQEKFGLLPEAVRQRLEAASMEQTLEWSRRILNAKTLDEVFANPS